jgi:Spy/CpxP family protein refolding chaperone
MEVNAMLRLSIVRFAAPVLVALPLALSACGSAVETQPATAENAVTRAPVATTAHGPVKLVGEALSDVPLRADQRADIEKLAADAETRHAATRDARKALTEAIAAQVEQGKIDRTAIQPKIDALVASMQAARPADRAAFERLHAILTPDQRVAFVDALEAKIQSRVSEHKGGKEHMVAWARDLNLSDDQRAQIKSALRAQFQAHHEEGAAAWHEGKEHGAKLLQAFKQDRFVMDEVAPPVDMRAGAAKMSDRFIGIVEQVLPILTPDQRAIAAKKLRERADSAEAPAPAF